MKNIQNKKEDILREHAHFHTLEEYKIQSDSL